MTGEWRNATIGELCSYINRGAAPAYVEAGGILVLSQKCVRDQRVSFAEARRTDPIRKPVAAERILRPLDILVNSTGVGTLGRVAQLSSLPEPATVDSHVTLVRPDPEAVSPRYLGYAVRNFEREIEALGEGSTGQTELARSRLAAFRVPVPPLPEQRAIAHILGTLDDKIELNRRMSETLEAMARAIFKSWFIDFDPVRAKCRGGPSWPPKKGQARGVDTGQPQGVAPTGWQWPQHILDLFPDRLVDSELGEIPEGWRVASLTDLVEINPPRSLRKGDIAPYLDMANMPTRGHAPDEVVERPFGSGMRFINGDTLVARITPCLENGKTAFVDFLGDAQVGWGSTEYIVLRPRPPLPEEFAYCLARSDVFREFAIQSMTGTSGRQRVQADSLGHFRLPRVPEPIAEAFGRAIKPLFARSSAAVHESRTLAALRDALLPKLISGEIRVKDAERFLKERGL